jgi:hypothetical protein
LLLCTCAAIAATAACVQRLAISPGPPMGMMPSAVTTAEPEWLPLAPRAGQRITEDAREAQLREPRRLTEGLDVAQLAWAPDARRLGYVARRPGAPRSSAELVDLASGQRSMVSRPEEEASSLRFLDDERVAFVASSGGRRFVVTAKLDGTERSTLELADEPVALSPSSGPGALWLTVKRGDAHAVARAGQRGGELRVVVGASSEGAPDASSARASIAFVGLDGSLRIASDEGRGERVLPRESYGRASHPVFAASGAHLYFSSDRDALGGELYRVDLEAQSWPPRAERLTYQQASVAAPSPDERWLAFASRRSGATADLHLARLRETARTRASR